MPLPFRATASLTATTREIINRKLAAGGSIGTQHRRAIDFFVRQTQAAGLFSKLSRCSLFSGDDLTSALVPEINTLGNATDTNNNFVSGDYNPMVGLTGNGSSKYLTMGINNIQLSQNNVHLSAYVTSLVAPATWQGLIGTTNDTTASLQIYIDAVTPTPSARIFNLVQLTNSNQLVGLRIGNRISASSFSNYVKTTVASAASASSAPTSTLAISVFGRGTAQFYSGSLGGYTLGSGLTPSEANQFSDIWDATMAMMGRPTT